MIKKYNKIISSFMGYDGRWDLSWDMLFEVIEKIEENGGSNDLWKIIKSQDVFREMNYAKKKSVFVILVQYLRKKQK